MYSFSECYKKLLKAYPDKAAKKYVEYGDYFIFLLVPKDNKNAMMFDSMFSVNKKTGKVGAYQPANDKNKKEFFKLWNKKPNPYPTIVLQKG